MNISMLGMPPGVAKEAWKEYRAALKVHKRQYLRETTRALSFLRRRKKLIDILVVFKDMVLKGGMPTLAIAPAWKEEITLVHRYQGRGEICGFSFPMPQFQSSEWSRRYTALVPNIPPHLLPKGNLRKGQYYILWEVEDWKVVPKDPILLKRISKNLFAVLGMWDLTPLEQSILRGKTL